MKPLPENPDAAKVIKAFLQWVERHSPKFVASEKAVYSKMFDYCGTMDCLAWIDEKLTVIDFKTGNPRFVHRQPKPYSKDFLQCAAYDQAYSEEFGTDADQYMLVYITKSGQLYDFTNQSVPENRTAWHAALVLSRQVNTLDRAY